MIYKGYEIRASVADWHYYRLNDDGTLGNFMGNGGADADGAEYEIYTTDEDEEVVDGGYLSIDDAKKAIDAMAEA